MFVNNDFLLTAWWCILPEEVFNDIDDNNREVRMVVDVSDVLFQHTQEIINEIIATLNNQSKLINN